MGVWLCAQPQPGAALSAEEQAALDARLWAAAKGGDAAAVERLAGEGASADAKDDWGPAVAAAAEKGHTEVMEALLRLGCDPNALDQYGATALRLAAGLGHGSVVGALLEHGGADLDTVNSSGYTALIWAAWSGHANCVEALLTAGADRTLRATGGEDEGKTALDIAEERGEGEAADFLHGRTALMQAARHGDAGQLRLLLEQGAAVDAADGDGMTALMEAAAEGKVECVRVLLAAEADSKRRATGGAHAGWDAVGIAQRLGRAEVLPLLAKQYRKAAAE